MESEQLEYGLIPVTWRRARVVERIHRGLGKLSPRGEIREMKPVKFGERPGRDVRANAEPSPVAKGRCREQTAGTYSREAMVKACSRPRTREGRRKPKWEENPPAARPCRFESGPGHQRHGASTIALKEDPR